MAAAAALFEQLLSARCVVGRPGVWQRECDQNRDRTQNSGGEQTPVIRRHHHPCFPPSSSEESTVASVCFLAMYPTLVMPRTLRKRSSGTFIGPGAGAVPGAGCGNAVDIAV